MCYNYYGNNITSQSFKFLLFNGLANVKMTLIQYGHISQKIIDKGKQFDHISLFLWRTISTFHLPFCWFKTKFVSSPFLESIVSINLQQHFIWWVYSTPLWEAFNIYNAGPVSTYNGWSYIYNISHLERKHFWLQHSFTAILGIPRKLESEVRTTVHVMSE